MHILKFDLALRRALQAHRIEIMPQICANYPFSASQSLRCTL